MNLHKNYDLIRSLVDSRFPSYRRRSVRDGVVMERIEMWHDLLEGALMADKGYDPQGETHWEDHILAAVERVYERLIQEHKGTTP